MNNDQILQPGPNQQSASQPSWLSKASGQIKKKKPGRPPKNPLNDERKEVEMVIDS